MLKLNKLGLLKKVVDGRAPDHFGSSTSIPQDQKHYTAFNTEAETDAMKRTFFHSTIKRLNALNLAPSASFGTMKTTLFKDTASTLQ